MGGRDHHRWESVGPRDIDCTFLYEIRKKFDVRNGLLWSHIAENATEVKAAGKVRLPGIYASLLCKRLLSCSTLVCEMTTPSLHSRISRMQTDLLLRLNAIVRNPLPFWLKILETSFLLPPSLTQCLGFTSFLCFLSATTRPESVGPRDIDCTFLYEIRKKFDVRNGLLWSHIAENATEVKAAGKVRLPGIYASLLCKRLVALPTHRGLCG